MLIPARRTPQRVVVHDTLLLRISIRQRRPTPKSRSRRGDPRVVPARRDAPWEHDQNNPPNPVRVPQSQSDDDGVAWDANPRIKRQKQPSPMPQPGASPKDARFAVAMPGRADIQPGRIVEVRDGSNRKRATARLLKCSIFRIICDWFAAWKQFPVASPASSLRG
jgi:hypothetical protein